MKVLGAPHYDTLVSNIDQTSPSWERSMQAQDDKVAQSFMTPPGPLGQQYPLHNVQPASTLHPNIQHKPRWTCTQMTTERQETT